MAQTVIEGTSMFTSSEIFTIYIKKIMNSLYMTACS